MDNKPRKIHPFGWPKATESRKTPHTSLIDLKLENKGKVVAPNEPTMKGNGFSSDILEDLLACLKVCLKLVPIVVGNQSPVDKETTQVQKQPFARPTMKQKERH
jgi:hypothetical protein